MTRPLFTVKTLRALARENGEIELPADALVTPAAADWLRGSAVRVNRVDAAPRRAASGKTIYVVGDARSPVVQTLLPILERQYDGVTFLACHGHLAGCLDAVREMCVGLAECSRHRGIALLEDGAIVNCVANKYAHVRAAIAAKPAALFGLVRKLGVNLLILENAQVALRQMRAVIHEFLTGKTSIDPAVEAALGRLPAPDSRSGSDTRSDGA